MKQITRILQVVSIALLLIFTTSSFSQQHQEDRQAHPTQSPRLTHWQRVEAVEKKYITAPERLEYYTRVLIQKDDESSRALAWLGLARLHSRAGDFEEAAKAYGHYSKLSPGDQRGWKSFADSAEHAERWDLAATAWTQLSKFEPGPQNRYALERQTIAQLKMRLEKKPNNPENLIKLADTYRRCRDLQGAIQAYKSAMETDPTRMKAWWGYGVSCQDTGDWEEAGRVWDEMLKLPLTEEWKKRLHTQRMELRIEKELAEGETAEGLSKLAALHMSSGNYEEALEALDKAIQEEPRHEWIKARAICLEKLKQWEKAAETWSTVASAEIEDKKVDYALKRWSSNLTQWLEHLRSRGEYAKALRALDSLDGSADFPEEVWFTAYKRLQRSMLLHEDLFNLGNVDVLWTREKGAWLIHRGNLQGSDGKLWLRQLAAGPVIISVEVEVDPQYPGQPGIGLCADPQNPTTTGYRFLFGANKEDARLYKPGKIEERIPGLQAPKGRKFHLELRAWEGSISVYQDGELVAALQDSHPLYDSPRPFLVGLEAKEGLVFFDNFRLYRLSRRSPSP